MFFIRALSASALFFTLAGPAFSAACTQASLDDLNSRFGQYRVAAVRFDKAKKDNPCAAAKALLFSAERVDAWLQNNPQCLKNTPDSRASVQNSHQTVQGATKIVAKACK
ncbi:hypothetical protein [Aestuariivirga sp.]|uniref:hypothetical protein n=1 Tax=Aestuariivirga sp. TaxID=2650926 RepID=UPI0039E3CACD